jgi:hypothetical protein
MIDQASNIQPIKPKRYLRHLVPAICAVFVIVCAIQVIFEACLKVPVIIRPRYNDVFETESAIFDWNYLVGIPDKNQSFLIQIASDPEFKRIIKAQTVKEKHVRFENILRERGPYFFRLRAVIEGRARKWSGTTKFYGPAGVQG